jgi:transcriptional regulator with XRE-family HTH domain
LEVAKRAGITTAFVSYLENGTRKGSLDVYIKLAEALKAPVMDLFKGGEKVVPYARPTPEEKLNLGGLSKPQRELLRRTAREFRTGNAAK